MNKLIISAALGAFVASGAVLSSAPDARAQECTYIILGCFKTRAAAEDKRAELGGDVIHTNDFPKFRSGFYCVADGPYDRQGSMLSQVMSAYTESVPDAYVKDAC